MKLVVINYGMGNLASVCRALEECGGEPVLSADPKSLSGADRIILPGVGAFGDGMKNLREAGWPDAIGAALQNPEVCLLGICLGMQLLADKGYEHGEHEGLGLVRGKVERMNPGDGERVPHVGWNELCAVRKSGLTAGISEGTDFYFVHSYHFNAEDESDVIGRTPYAGVFVSAVQHGNVFGTQFHPEKSSFAGFRLLKNFLGRPLDHA
ncbi:MAG: imidazole glycerol phosphate synthase subunit HisH [Xanthobacteraceae bacterium]|nr:imidazole glycerol phosphate synthase subunit HisH [Xanthobacteraceae bacterium]